MLQEVSHEKLELISILGHDLRNPLNAITGTIEILTERNARGLTASGVTNRWHKGDEFIVYAGGSIALSMLELVAHRSAIHLNIDYKLLSIDLVVDQHDVTGIQLASLPADWRSISQYPVLQEIGSRWYQRKNSLMLKVPSALIPWEHNFLINTTHPDFSVKVSLSAVEDFEWDGRLF